MTKPKVGDRYRLYCTGQDGADGTYEVTVDAVKRLATGVYRLGAVRPGRSCACGTRTRVATAGVRRS